MTSGGAIWDDVSMTGGDDYKLTSEGETANVAGVYPITVTLLDISSKIKDLKQRYNINLKSAEYTLTSTGYKVIANAGSNGNITITSEFPGSNVAVPVSSGDNLPETSKVTIMATPNAGYVVSRWKLGDDYLLDGESFITDATYIIDSLNKGAVVNVEFVPGVNKLTFAPNENGTITANHLNGGIPGDSFNSGENVNFSQIIRLNAQPESGYAIEKWEITRADETVILLADNGVSDFTGNTYDFSRFNKDTTVKVFFVKDGNPKITICPVDKDKKPYSNVTVSLNGSPLSAEGGIYSYTGKTGDNLSITVIPTDGLLVQEWNVGESQTTGSLSNNNKTMALYNLRSDIDFTIVCAALNDYEVSFGGQLIGEGDGEKMGSVTATKIGDSSIETSSRQLKGSTIQFTATAAEGYEIMGWELNEEKVVATSTGDYNTQTYQIPNLNKNEKLVVIFQAKPTVNWVDGTGGTISITGTKDGIANQEIASGDYLDYNTGLHITVTPDKGYTADDLMGVNPGEAPDDSDIRTGDISDVEENIYLEFTFTELDTKNVFYSVVVLDNEDSGYHGTLKGQVSRKNMESYSDTDEVGITNVSRDVYEGGEIKLTTMADPGYRVKEWYVDGEEYQRDGDTFTGGVLIVPYEDLGEKITVQFELGDARITFLDPEHGMLSAKVGEEDFESGGTSKDWVIFTASPDDNYEIKQWMVDNEVQSRETDNTFEYYPDDSNVIIAVELQGKILNLTAQANKGGSVEPVGLVRYGDSVTFNATVDTGYTFDGWYLNDVKVCENLEYTFTAYEDGLYGAGFIDTSGKTVSFKVNDEEMGSVFATVGASNLASGSEVGGGKSVEITVVAKEGYRFQQWTGLPENATSNKDTATFIMGDEDVDLSAILEEIPIYTIKINETNHGAVTAEVDGEVVIEVLDGTEVTFTAKADANWMLDQWTDGAQGQTDKVFTIPVTNNIIVGATFKDAVNYTVHFSVVDGKGSIGGKANETTISPNTVVQCVGGSKLVFTAQPEDNYMVKEWKIDQEIQVNNLSNTSIIEYHSKNTTVTVEYEELKLHNIPQNGESYKITDLTRTPNDYGAGTGQDHADQIRDRGTVTFTVTPEDLDPDHPGYIGKLIINGYNCISEIGSYKGGEISTKKNENGSYIITISGVTQDIIATIEANKIDIKDDPDEYLLSEDAKKDLKKKLEVTEDVDLAGAIKLMLGSKLTKINASNGRSLTHYEVTLQKWENDKWIPVTNINEFPEDGLDVVLPYPKGAGIKDSYTIAHMYTTDSDKHSVGDIEIFTQNGKNTTNKYTAKGDGIHIHVDSLSPFAIGWTKHTIEPPRDDGEDDSGGGGGGGGPVPVLALHTIEAVATVGGTITPSGNVSVKDGKSQTFMIQADAGYLISDVLVDGKSLGAFDTYTFKKVNKNHSILANFIEDSSMIGTGVADWLETDKHISYLAGYLDGSFRPNNNMSRAEVAQMFYGLLLDKDVKISSNYSDVSTDAWYERAVNTLISIGMIKGVGDNQFAPNRSITRAEFIAIAMRFAKLETSSEKIFSDVSPSDWFYTQVSGGVQYGWINGYNDGSFRPNDSITRAEVVTIVNLMLGRSADLDYIDANMDELHLFTDVEKTSWTYYLIIEATNGHDYNTLKDKESWIRLY